MNRSPFGNPISSRRSPARHPLAPAFLAATALCVACLLPPRLSPALADPGDLDADFADAGIFVSPPADGISREGNGVAIQKDGKIVVAGKQVTDGNVDLAVWRLKPDGSLDPRFGSGGGAVLDLAGFQEGLAVALQKDGKIVVAGFEEGVPGNRFIVARFNGDGARDASFNGSGFLTQGFGPDTSASAFAVAVQKDGRIVAAGEARDGALGDGQFGLARFKSNGTPDANFGGNGLVATEFGLAGTNTALAVALQKDGKIVAAGQVGREEEDGSFGLARYRPDGSLDSGFGTAGKVITEFGGNDIALGLAIQGDGKIVAAGGGLVGGQFDFALARYKKNGSLDSGFGVGGKVTTDFGVNDLDIANGLALQKDGRLVAVGRSRVGGIDHLALARYQKNGRRDRSFGGDGLIVTPVGDFEFGQSVAVQKDGKIVAAGLVGFGNFVVVARYLAR